jgi:hypothetical protein
MGLTAGIQVVVTRVSATLEETVGTYTFGLTAESKTGLVRTAGTWVVMPVEAVTVWTEARQTVGVSTMTVRGWNRPAWVEGITRLKRSQTRPGANATRVAVQSIFISHVSQSRAIRIHECMNREHLGRGVMVGAEPEVVAPLDPARPMSGQ